jgi:transcriptional antiterminator RfaH
MKRWYAIHCKPRKEDVVSIQLELRNVEVFYPRILIRKKDHKSVSAKPYFPGYLFICVDQNDVNWSKIKWVPFTLGVVGYGMEPIPIPDSFISQLKNHLEMINLERESYRLKFKEGDDIRITDGPLEGYVGAFLSCKSGQERANILVKLIENQFIQIELPIYNIRHEEVRS